MRELTSKVDELESALATEKASHERTKVQVTELKHTLDSGLSDSETALVQAHLVR